MTYYGRWTYKYEIASREGRGGRDPGPRDRPGGLSRSRSSRELGPRELRHRHDAGPATRTGVAVEGWIDLDEGQGALRRRPARTSTRSRRPPSGRDFRPVPLGAQAEFDGHEHAPRGPVAERRRPARGLRPGAQGRVRHLHRPLGPPRPRPDARRATRSSTARPTTPRASPPCSRSPGRSPGSSPPPKRSILFLAVTAEEKGLLGAKYYADAPALSAREDAGRHQHGRDQPLGPDRRDIVSIGLGQSTLDDLLVEVAEGAGPDRRARRRAREGAITTAPTTSSSPSRASPRSTPRGASTTSASPPTTARRSATSTPQNDYHKVSDEVKPDWDLSGAVEDMQAPARGRLPGRRGDRVPRVEARTASSRPAARRCSRPRGHDAGRDSDARVAGRRGGARRLTTAIGDGIALGLVLAAAGRGRRPGSTGGTAGSRRRSTSSPTSSTRSRSWRGSAGRRQLVLVRGAPGDRLGAAGARPAASAPGSAGTAGSGWRSSASATRSGRRSGSAAATCRSSRATAAIISKSPRRSSAARGRSSTTSRASSPTTPRSARARASSTTGPRRSTPTCWPAPSGSPGSCPGESLEATVGVAKACSFVLNLLALPALYGFARRRFGREVGLGAMAVLAVLPVHAIYAGFVLRESLVGADVDPGRLDADRGLGRAHGPSAPGPGPSLAGLCGGLAILARNTGAGPDGRGGPATRSVAHGRRRLGPAAALGRRRRSLVIAPWALRDLPRVRHSRSTRTRITSSTTSPGRSTTTRRGTPRPSQFYTRANAPEIVRVKVKSLLIIVVYSTMIVGLPLVAGFLGAAAATARTAPGATSTSWSRRSSWSSCWRRSRASPT